MIVVFGQQLDVDSNDWLAMLATMFPIPSRRDKDRDRDRAADVDPLGMFESHMDPRKEEIHHISGRNEIYCP